MSFAAAVVAAAFVASGSSLQNWQP